jgi:PilZ domain-containing protein
LTDRINPPEAACGGEWLHKRQDGEAMQSPVMQQYPRLFARLRPEGRVSKIAKIFVGPKAPVIECILVDYSAGGACLQLPKFIQLPDRFEILYGTTRKRCRVVWKRALRIGVAF